MPTVFDLNFLNFVLRCYDLFTSAVPELALASF